MNNTSIISQIKNRIENSPYGSVFVVSDFTDLAEYETIKRSIARLEKEGVLRRVSRGIYDKPKFSQLLQEYSVPDPCKVAHAIARNYKWDICACGDTVLNQMGISTQVPANWSYISSGPYKQYTIGNVNLVFNHRSGTLLNGFSANTLLVIQAVKALGQTNIGDAEIELIRKQFSAEERKQILLEAQHTMNWIYSVIKAICR